MDDRALIRAIASGDTDAFERLFIRFSRRLLRYITSITGDVHAAEDLLIEVMFTVWQKAPHFEHRSRVSTWIMGIARHKAFDFIRRMKNRIPPAELLNYETTEPSPHEYYEDVERLILFEEAFFRLNPIHREVLQLAFGEGLSYREIAELLECPLNTVKTRVFYARQYLRQWLTRRSSHPTNPESSPRTDLNPPANGIPS